MNNNYYNQYSNPYYQQPAQQYPQYQQPNFIPTVYVNGLEEAKRYYMGTNQIAYLRDNTDDSILYEKRSDNFGKFYLKAFKLTELELDNNGGFTNKADGFAALNAKLDAICSMLSVNQGGVPNESVNK